MKKSLKKSSSSGMSNGAKIGAGVLTAAALAAAAAYFLSGKEGEKRRAKMKAWAVKAQKEVEKNVKSAKKLGAVEYARIVDEATKRYGSLENVSSADVMAAAKEMKSKWTKIQGHAKMIAKELQMKKKPATATRAKGVKKSAKKK